jgi:hypothetical protein
MGFFSDDYNVSVGMSASALIPEESFTPFAARMVAFYLKYKNLPMFFEMERASSNKTGVNALNRAIEWSRINYPRGIPTAEGVALTVASKDTEKIVYNYLVAKGTLKGTIGSYPAGMPFNILKVRVGTLSPKEIDQYALENFFKFDPKTFEITYNGSKYFIGYSVTDDAGVTQNNIIRFVNDNGATRYNTNDTVFISNTETAQAVNAYNDLYIPSISEAIDSYLAIHYPMNDSDATRGNPNYITARNEMLSKYANQLGRGSYVRYELSKVNEVAFISTITLDTSVNVADTINSNAISSYKVVYIPIYGSTSQYPEFTTSIANVFRESVFPPVLFFKDPSYWLDPEGTFPLTTITRTKRPCSLRNSYINNLIGDPHETYSNIGECHDVSESLWVEDNNSDSGGHYIYTRSSYFDLDITTTIDTLGGTPYGGHPYAHENEAILDMLGYSYRDLYGSLKGSLQGNGDVQTVALNFGVKLNTNSTIGKEYIYAFMEMLYETMGKAPGNYVTQYYDPKSPDAGSWAISDGNFLFGTASNALGTLSNSFIIKDLIYNYVLSGTVIKEIITSSSMPVGTVIVEHVVTPATTVSNGMTNSEDGSSGYTTIPASDDLVVTKQISETQQIIYKSNGLQQRHSIVVRRKWMSSAYTAPYEYMYFPIEMGVLNTLDSITANDVVKMSLMTTIFAGEVSVTSPADSWTQLGKGVVGMIIMVFCESCAPYIMAAMAMTIMLSPVIAEFLGSGNIFKQIIAVILIIIIAWVGSGANSSWDKVLNAKFLVNTVSTTYTIYIQGEINSIQAKLKGLSEQYDAALKKIEEETEELDLDPSINVGEEYTRLGLVESISGFFARTTDSSYTMHCLNTNSALDLNARLTLPI